MSSSSSEFYRILRDCDFHPDNQKNSPNELMIQKTRVVLILSWNLDHLAISGRRYNRISMNFIYVDTVDWIQGVQSKFKTQETKK